MSERENGVRQERLKGALLGGAATLMLFLLYSIIVSATQTSNTMNSGMSSDMMSMMDSSNSDAMMKMMSDPRMQDHSEECLKMMDGMTEEKMIQHMKMCEMMMEMMS